MYKHQKSSETDRPSVTTTPTNADTASLAAYIERLIESQPGCLMRLDLDGRLLAANSASLRLLSTGDHSRALGRLLTERIGATHHADWRLFLSRAWNEESGATRQHPLRAQGLDAARLRPGRPDSGGRARSRRALRYQVGIAFNRPISIEEAESPASHGEITDTSEPAPPAAPSPVVLRNRW